MDKRSKLDIRAREYAEKIWKEGDEPTLITFRSVKSYKDGALEERARIRKRFYDNLREIKVAQENLRALIDQLEQLVSPNKDG